MAENALAPEQKLPTAPPVLPDDEVLYELADLFRVFGDSTRIKILYALHDDELCVQDIANAVQLSQSAVSHQLRVLKDSKLVRFRRDGKTLNRMNDLVPNVRIEGDVRLRGEDIFSKEMQLTDLRRRVGMVFQKANPFPMSIYDNITYGPKLHGVRNKAELDELVESSLRGAALWDEVKDRLKKSALGLSGGQQQRLCIARALAVKPEVLLMDEPTSALDPGSTMKVEELMSELKKNYTVVIVTHNMQQAARISDRTAFFLLGELVECGPTSEIFSTPKDKRTEDYISGRFG